MENDGSARFRSREWMVAIGKLRRYEKTARPRRVLVDDWKVRMIVAPDEMTREEALRIGRAAGVSARQIYKVRSQNGKGRRRGKTLTEENHE